MLAVKKIFHSYYSEIKEKIIDLFAQFKTRIDFIFKQMDQTLTKSSGYFAVDGNLPLESILP